MSLRPQACSRHWHVARKTLKRHVLCSFPLWLEMAHTNCSPWCSHCNPAVGLGSVQDHLLGTLHLLWLWKSGYKLKPLWEGPSTPGFLIPNMPFSSWAAIPFSVLFFPRCSLFPFPNVAQEAETWSFLQTWPQCCCCGAAKGSRRVAQPHLCALWRIFVCLGPFKHLSCYMLGMNHFPQHLCSLMWAVTNQTKHVLSLFHPLFCVFQDIKADTSCWDSVWGWRRSGMMCRRCSANPRGEGWDVPAHPLLQGWCKCVHVVVGMWCWQRYLL